MALFRRYSQQPVPAVGSLVSVSKEGSRMFAIIGILLVFRAVIGGFLMEKGQLAVLVQPAEFLIIVGAGLGTLLIANPMHILKGIFAGAMGVFGKSH